MTQTFKCENPSCTTNFKDKNLMFKLKKNNVQGLFCFNCVTQINKSDGWEMKSRESLARYKDMTGEDFVPYEDPGDPNDIDVDRDSSLNKMSEALEQVGSHHKARNLIDVLEELAESSTGEPMPKLLEKIALLDKGTDS